MKAPALYACDLSTLKTDIKPVIYIMYTVINNKSLQELIYFLNYALSSRARDKTLISWTLV